MSAGLKVLTIGSLSFDYIGTAVDGLRSDAFVTSLESLVQSPGGRGGNFAVFAQSLGCDVRLVAPVGTNFRASSYHKDLLTRGVDLASLSWSDSPETQSVFLFSSGDDVRIYVYRDRRRDSEESYRDWAVKVAVEPGWDAVYCTSETPSLNSDILNIVHSRFRVFSPGPDIHLYGHDCLQSCLASSNVILVNSSEMAVIREVMGRDPISHDEEAIWVITEGAIGSTVRCQGESIAVTPSVNGGVVDSIGAGDAYAAGFVYGLLAGSDMKHAARTASVTASFAIEARGCQSVIPTLPEVLRRRAESYDHIESE